MFPCEVAGALCLQVLRLSEYGGGAVFVCMQRAMFYDVSMKSKRRRRRGCIPVVRSKNESGFVWLGFVVLLFVFFFFASFGDSVWEAYGVCWTLEWFGLPYALAVYVRSAYEGTSRPSFLAMAIFPWSAAFHLLFNDYLEPETDDRCYGEGEGNGRRMTGWMFAGVLLGFLVVGWPVAMLPWVWMWW